MIALMKNQTLVALSSVLLVFGFCTIGRAGEIHDAVVDEDTDQVVELITKDAKLVNETNEDGETPLHLAADNGNVKIVKLLLAFGADVNGKDNDGSTPLHRAVQSSSAEVVEALLAKGADIDARNSDGNTPLKAALEREEKAKAVTELLRKAAKK